MSARARARDATRPLRGADRSGAAPCRAWSRGTPSTNRRTRAPARTPERSRCWRARTCRSAAHRTSPGQSPSRVGGYRRSPMSRRGDRVVITNRKARYDYFVLDTYECGIVLKGPEVKSIRNGRANLQDGYARIDDGEVWLFGMHVSPYEFSRGDLDPVRPRKLLLHHKQIVELARATEEKGVTLVPLSVYFKDGRAKVELAVARGKARYDKRQAIAERDAKRETQRAMK